MGVSLAQRSWRAISAHPRAATLALAAVILASPSLLASPWTLKQHEVVTGLDVNFASADREFLENGERQRYPLNGEFISSTYSLSTRYGFTDKLEIDAALQIKSVSFDIDPVILDLPSIEQNITYDLARNSITDFANQDLGVGDLNVAMRYKAFDATYFILTPQVGIKVPMGYRAPEGTFDSLEESIADPERGFIINDDVTLGDGQIDLSAGLLLGAYLPTTRTFARVDVLYNHRFGAPGDQVILHPKVGQFVWEGLLFFGGMRWVETITQGDSIGITWIDTGNQQDASTFTLSQTENLPLFLDRSYTFIEAGVLLAIGDVSLQAYIQETLSGENYADLRVVGFSALVSIPGATAPVTLPEPTPVETYDDQAYEEAPVDEPSAAAPLPAPEVPLEPLRDAADEPEQPVDPIVDPAPTPIDPS